MKEEIVQQKAALDLILSSHSIFDKNLTKLIDTKILPLIDSMSSVKADLETLRLTVNKQTSLLSITVDKLNNITAQPSYLIST